MNNRSSSYDNLRKRAKRLLRDAQAGDEPLLWRFKRSHPRFESSDIDAIQGSIKLVDAQLVIAREWGYEKWAHLKKAALDGFGGETVSAKLNVDEMVTFVPSRDFEASINFYQEIFAVNWRTDKLCEIQAGKSKFLIQDFYVAEWANNCMYQLLVDDIDEVWETLKSSGVLTRHGGVRAEAPKEEEWGWVVYLFGPAGELWQLTEYPE